MTTPTPQRPTHEMSDAEVNAFLETEMRKKFGPQAELMIQITRITRQLMADQEVAQVQPTRRNT